MLHLHVYLYSVYVQGPQGSEEGIEPLGTKAIVGWEPLDVGAGNRTHEFWESIQCSQPLSYPQSPQECSLHTLDNYDTCTWKLTMDFHKNEE